MVLRESTTQPGKIAVSRPNGVKCLLDDFLARNPNNPFSSPAEIIDALTAYFSKAPIAYEDRSHGFRP